MHFSYNLVTEATVRAIEMFSIQAHVSPLGSQRRLRDKARGALRTWEEIVGAAAVADDRRRIAQTIDDMPGQSAPGDQNYFGNVD